MGSFASLRMTGGFVVYGERSGEPQSFSNVANRQFVAARRFFPVLTGMPDLFYIEDVINGLSIQFAANPQYHFVQIFFTQVL
jgi:hypothetical protein